MFQFMERRFCFVVGCTRFQATAFSKGTAEPAPHPIRANYTSAAATFASVILLLISRFATAQSQSNAPPSAADLVKAVTSRYLNGRND
jgi:hypothetical protein